jgi:hypothetical protein
LAYWIGSLLRAHEFLGGVSEIVVPDNVQAGVTKPCRYEPDINRTYEELAAHYGVAAIPARQITPREKPRSASRLVLLHHLSATAIEYEVLAILYSASNTVTVPLHASARRGVPLMVSPLIDSPTQRPVALILL